MFEGSLAETTLALVSCASVTARERELCDRLVAELPGEKKRWRDGFVYLPRSLQPRLPTLALVGHLDTVPPAQDQDLEIRDGRVYGCGATDMKGGVAVMLHLLRSEAAACNLVGLFYDREEGPYRDNGLDPLLELAPSLDLAIVLEPTCNAVQVGCVGSIQARAYFRGRRAHSARPWQGDNAIFQALPLLEKLRSFERREVVLHGQRFYEVLTPTIASTPNGATNVVPELFTLNLNYRFAPGKSPEAAVAELRALVDGELEVLDVAPAGDVRLDDGWLKRWIEGEGLAVEPKQAWTDVARLTARGVPAINFGPGDPALAHQPQEFVSIEALEECRSRLARLIEAASGQSAQ